MKRIIVIIAAIIAVVIMFLGANQRKKQSVDKSQPVIETTLTIAAVSTENVKKMKYVQKMDFLGTLDAWKEISVAAETQGKIERLTIEEGQYKYKGDTLAVLDNKLKKLAVENAKINLKKIKGDLDRATNLFNGGTASQQQLDDLRSSYENYSIQLDQAEKQLSDAVVIAPVSGIITKKYVEQGSYINTGNTIATIVDISKLRVRFNVSEVNAYLLKAGDSASITTDVYPEITFYGLISYISSQGDDTHNYPVEITIENSSKYPLKAGTFANVHIIISDSQLRLYIPRKALQGSIFDASVYTVDNGKAIFKKIIIGKQNGEYLEVISGLTEKECVVVAGQVNLSDGKTVSIVNR